MRTILIATAILGAFLIAGCRGGEGESATPLTDQEFLFAATAAVNAVLLTEKDLPASFDLTDEGQGDGEDEPDPVFSFTGDCEEFNQYFDASIEQNWRDSVVESETGDFEDPDGDEFSSNAAAFRDAAAAQHETDDMARFFELCTDQFEAQFEQYLTESLLQVGAEDGSEVTDIGVAIRAIPVPVQGDWTHALRTDMTFTVDGLPLRVVSDTVTVRRGRMVATVDATYTGELEESLEALRDSVVATTAARLAAEEPKLGR